MIKIYCEIEDKEFYRASLLAKGFKIHHYTISSPPFSTKRYIVFHVTPSLKKRIGDAIYAIKATILDYFKRKIFRPTARLLDRNRLR